MLIRSVPIVATIDVLEDAGRVHLRCRYDTEPSIIAVVIISLAVLAIVFPAAGGPRVDTLPRWLAAGAIAAGLAFVNSMIVLIGLGPVRERLQERLLHVANGTTARATV